MTFSCLLPVFIPGINGYYFGKKKAAIPHFTAEQLIRVAGVWLLIQILTEQGNLPSPEIAVWGILFGEVTAALYSVTMLLFSHEKT